jgi:SAM-dependent methyltransferase
MKSLATKLRTRLASQLRGRILDCGCGDDVFGPTLRRPGNTVVSLDVDLVALRRVPGLRVVADCARLPFRDDSFDAVWACAVIEHLTRDCLPELIRVTRPGGRLVAVTPNAETPFDWLKRLCGFKTWGEIEGHVRLYTLKELRSFGPVHGETWFVPLLDWFFWRVPRFAHVLILDLLVTEAVKERARARASCLSVVWGA